MRGEVTTSSNASLNCTITPRTTCKCRFRLLCYQAKDATEDLVETTKFMMLGLELPPAPLYKDSLETNIIPQVKKPTVVFLRNPIAIRSC